ncbi:MAG: lysophospholipid acyltransferase family protein [Candidatus Hydrogenedentes bacterium]|nr:lysophospholipid acyltransferase family protein [Candidatus Hydrogenedentota bacterium]
MQKFEYRFGQVHPVVRWAARVFFKITGWKATGDFPSDPKMVAIIAPHTSNWDVILLLALSFVTNIRANWLVKHTLFFWPLKYLMEAAGGVPLDRNKRQNTVDQAVALFQSHDRLYLALAPEGTRFKTSHWKTGFYHIAVKAGVPILLLFEDYAKKEVGFGPLIHPSGDIEKDFEIIRAFYADKVPKNPEERSEMALPAFERHEVEARPLKRRDTAQEYGN